MRDRSRVSECDASVGLRWRYGPAGPNLDTDGLHRAGPYAAVNGQSRQAGEYQAFTKSLSLQAFEQCLPADLYLIEQRLQVTSDIANFHVWQAEHAAQRAATQHAARQARHSP